MKTGDAFRIDGKIALVTGGARDLGYDMAEALAEAGARLIITSRSLQSAEKAAVKLRSETGTEVLPLALDQRTHDVVKHTVSRAHEWKGRIDILVNNAGGGGGASSGPAHLFERNPAEAIDLITVNLIGALHCCQEVGRIMAAQKSGKIINIASMAGMMGRDRRMYENNQMKGQPIDYAAAKAGVIGMTMDLAGLLSPMGIYVNAISPGGFGPRGVPDGFARDYNDNTPLGRMGRDGIDLKGAVVFLASQASDYVTGHNLVVDGGFSIWH